MVDIVENNIGAYIQIYHQLASYLINTCHTHTFELLGFSKKIIDTFDQETQAKVKEAAQEATSYWWERLEEYEEESFAALRNTKGFVETIHLVDLSDEQRAQMREIVCTDPTGEIR